MMNITTKVFFYFFLKHPFGGPWTTIQKPPCSTKMTPAKILAKCEGQDPLNKVHIFYNSECMADGKHCIIFLSLLC